MSPIRCFSARRRAFGISAKTANDYAAFAPYLEKIIDANRRIAFYIGCFPSCV